MNTTGFSELDRVKLKIKALADKTVANGCTEEEALAAMAGVGRLLSQYNLSMDEIDVRQAKCKTIYINNDRKKRHPIDGCVVALADFVGAKTWFSSQWAKVDNKYQKTTAYAFFAQEQDCELVEYLFRVIRTAIDTEAKKFRASKDYELMSITADCDEDNYAIGGKRRSAYVSFQRGMAYRISERLHEMKQQNDAEMEAVRASTGRALMVLKGQLVEEEWEKEGIKLSSNYYVARVRDTSAYQRGRAAGDKVNLNRPLNANKAAGYLS